MKEDSEMSLFEPYSFYSGKAINAVLKRFATYYYVKRGYSSPLVLKTQLSKQNDNSMKVHANINSMASFDKETAHDIRLLNTVCKILTDNLQQFFLTFVRSRRLKKPVKQTIARSGVY